MKKNYMRLMGLVVALFVSVAAMAQYNVEITENEKGNYNTTNTTFSLSDVAEKLGISASELDAALTTWYNNGGYNQNVETFALAAADGTTISTTHSADDGGYYMNETGELSYWGNGAPWYIQLDWDAEADELYIMVGQNANVDLSAGGSYHCYVAINVGESQVLFDVSLTIKEREKMVVEPVPFLSKLNIVGRSTFEVLQEPNNSWYRHYYTMSVDGMAEALDIDVETLTANMRDIIYAKTYDATYESFADQLTNTITASPAPGFWFGTGVLLAGEEEESDELQHAAYGSTDKFWVADIQYFDDDSLSFCMGQYPESWAMGEKRHAEIYYIYGDKAWVVDYVLTVDVPHDDVIGNLTSIGSETIELQRNPRLGYEADTVAFDVKGLFEKLGAESILDIRVATDDQYGNLTDVYTADTTGFWFTPSGEVTNHSAGSASFYIDYVDSLGVFAIGNMPDAFSGGEECTAKIYFIKDGKYYEYDFKVTMDTPQYTIETCEVTELNFEVKLVPTPNGGAWEIGSTDMAPYEEMLGTASGVLYGLDATGALTNKYTVSEATAYGGGGFWMSPEDENHYAYAASYSNTDESWGAFAVWYYQGTMHWFNCPGRRNPGEYSTAVFYLFNLWDGKALKLNTTIKFVDEIVEDAGEMNIYLKARNEEGNDAAETEINLADMYTALGCTEEVFAENGTWAVMTTDSVLLSRQQVIEKELYDEIIGFPFTADGLLDTGDAGSAYCYADIIEGKFYSYIVDDENIDTPCNITFYARYNGRQYKVNVTVCQTEPSGINQIAATTTAGKTYDLTGREVKNLAKGLYIQDGKKVLVK